MGDTCTIKTPLPEDEALQLAAELSDWKLSRIGGSLHLEKSYGFKNFIQAMDFANRIAEIAERNRHHPDLIIGWGKTIVRWQTHSAKGLLPIDFDMARACDEITVQPA